MQISATNSSGTGSAALVLTVSAADTTAPFHSDGSLRLCRYPQARLIFPGTAIEQILTSRVPRSLYRLSGTAADWNLPPPDPSGGYRPYRIQRAILYRLASDPSHRTSAQSAVLLVTTLAATGSPTFAQQSYATPQSPKSTVPVTFASAQTAGNLNVVVVGWNDTTATVSSVTDSKGNVYARAVGPTVLSGQLSQAIYYAKNIQAAAANTNTVTVQFNVAAAYPDIRILEFSGIDAANPVDVTAAATGTTATSSSGAATTTNGNDLIFGANMVSTATSGPGLDLRA